MKISIFFILFPLSLFGQSLVSNPPLGELNKMKQQYFPFYNPSQEILYFTGRENNLENIYLFQGEIIKILSNPYNEGTACFSMDGNTMILSECQSENSFGSCDLVERKWMKDHWGEAKNLGFMINSRDWEGHPYLSKDGKTLYFSSDRYGGIGRKDLWKSVKKGDTWSEPEIIEKVNSSYDELGPYLIEEDTILIYSSNRPGGMGGLDFYQYNLKTQESRIWEALNTELDEAGISLENWNKEEENQRVFLYSKDVSQDGEIQTEIWRAVFNQIRNETSEEPKKLDKGHQKQFEYLTINFDVNSFIIGEITENMRALKEYLQENQSLRIEIIGHTDDSGLEENNQILSEKRAESLKNWLFEQGISSSRVTVRGVGSSQPLSTKREENRRIEIRFLGLKP